MGALWWRVTVCNRRTFLSTCGKSFGHRAGRFRSNRWEAFLSCLSALYGQLRSCVDEKDSQCVTDEREMDQLDTYYAVSTTSHSLSVSLSLSISLFLCLCLPPSPPLSLPPSLLSVCLSMFLCVCLSSSQILTYVSLAVWLFFFQSAVHL